MISRSEDHCAELLNLELFVEHAEDVALEIGHINALWLVAWNCHTASINVRVLEGDGDLHCVWLVSEVDALSSEHLTVERKDNYGVLTTNVIKVVQIKVFWVTDQLANAEFLEVRPDVGQLALLWLWDGETRLAVDLVEDVLDFNGEQSQPAVPWVRLGRVEHVDLACPVGSGLHVHELLSLEGKCHGNETQIAERHRKCEGHLRCVCDIKDSVFEIGVSWRKPSLLEERLDGSLGLRSIKLWLNPADLHVGHLVANEIFVVVLSGCVVECHPCVNMVLEWVL